MSTFLLWFSVAVAIIGTIQASIGALLTRVFIRRSRLKTHEVEAPSLAPPVTILKPLHGDEPLLDEALISFCQQDYPRFQIIFGVHSGDDTAIAVVKNLRRRFPECDLQLVIDSAVHGVNHKVSNLINMYALARHDLIVIADSDIHAPTTYLKSLIQLLLQPGIGLVTTLYAGLPASRSIISRFGAAQINHFFMPGVLLSRRLGREDCLGATMALRRETLDRIGGLEALVNHVADDAVLGHKVQDLGMGVALAPCLTETTVTETSLSDLFHHELRWGRTIKNVEPLGYALSSTQLSLFWAAAVVLLCHASAPAIGFFVIIWLVRYAAASVINRSLGRPDAALNFSLPLRDCFSAFIMLCSLRGQKVAWRGKHLHIRRHVRATPSRPNRLKVGK